MRILQIVHGFPPEAIAGTEHYCESLCRCLLRRGYECVVLAGSERSAPEATLATVDQDGLLVTRYLRANGRPRRWMEEYDPEAEGLARRLVALVQPDIVHLHHWRQLSNNLVAMCADQRIPVVVTLHDVWTSCPRIHRIRWDGAFCAEPPASAPCLSCAERGPWQGDEEISRVLALRREMMETELALATAIVVPSEAHRALLLSLLHLAQERLIVLSHGSLSDVMVKKGSGGRSAFPNRPLQIGHWGYLVYEKGTHLILEAVHKLRDPSAVQVHLVGTTIKQEYEQRLQELACDISVQFHGAYRPADLQTFDFDLAIFPSIASESYSFALDEALRLELPVLVSDRGALAERIGGAGLTFRAGDADDLARRLQEILDTPETLERMRRRIRPETLFSMEAHVAMLEKIYEDAAHAKRPESKSSTPYLKLIAHVQQQVVEREEALARLQQQLACAQARVQELEAERAAEAQARQAAEARSAELQSQLAAAQARVQELEAERAAEAQARQAAEARSAELQSQLAAQEEAMAALAKEHEVATKTGQLAAQRVEELAGQLASLKDANRLRVEELERALSMLTEERDSIARRLAEFEQTPAARLQSLVVKLTKARRRGI